MESGCGNGGPPASFTGVASSSSFLHSLMVMPARQRILLLLAAVQPLSAQYQPATKSWYGKVETYFPTDRANCRSDNKGCIIGNELMANDFPIRTDEAQTFDTDATVDHDLPQESSWQPSKALKESYDYSGGLVRDADSSMRNPASAAAHA